MKKLINTEAELKINVAYKTKACSRLWWISVCVCVCARACVCVCLYSSTVKASSVYNDVWDILEGTDQRSCVVSIIPGASAKYLHLRCQKCHISPPKLTNWRENDMVYCAGEKMIY